MKMSVFSASVAVSLAMFPCLVLAQTTHPIAIDCDNISIEECSKQLPFSVTMDAAIAAHEIVFHKITTTPLDDLRRMLDDSGIANYVIFFDREKNNVIISYLTNKNSADVAGVLPNGGNSTIVEGKTIPQPVGGEQPQQVIPYPGEISIPELNARAAKENDLNAIDPDEEISLLGGEKISLRQLQAWQKRVDVSIPAGEMNLSPVPGGEILTYDDLKEMKMKSDAAAQEVGELPLLNGARISREELESLLKLGKTTEGAAKGFLLQNNASLPSGPGLITIKQ